MKTFSELITEFKFNQHKSYGTSYIPDDCYERLASVYGIDEKTITETALQCAEHNRLNAQNLCSGSAEEFRENPAPFNLGFIGDSITAYRESYANIIKTFFLPYRQAKVFDFAVSGARSGDILSYMHPFIWENNLDIVHIMIGTNDCRRINDDTETFHTLPEEYEKNMSYIISSFRKSGASVIVTSIPPYSTTRLEKALPQYKLLYLEKDRLLFNTILENQCQKHDAIYNDMEPVYSNYKSKDLTLDDGLHLNELGHKLLAKNVFQLIEKEIKELKK